MISLEAAIEMIRAEREWQTKAGKDRFDEKKGKADWIRMFAYYLGRLAEYDHDDDELAVKIAAIALSYIEHNYEENPSP